MDFRATSSAAPAGTFDTLLSRRRQTRRLLVFSCAALAAAAADALVALGFGLFQGDHQSPPHAQIPAAHAAAYFSPFVRDHLISGGVLSITCYVKTPRRWWLLLRAQRIRWLNCPDRFNRRARDEILRLDYG
jgi:hypothetical protein